MTYSERARIVICPLQPNFRNKSGNSHSASGATLAVFSPVMDHTVLGRLAGRGSKEAPLELRQRGFKFQASVLK